MLKNYQTNIKISFSLNENKVFSREFRESDHVYVFRTVRPSIVCVHLREGVKFHNWSYIGKRFMIQKNVLISLGFHLQMELFHHKQSLSCFQLAKKIFQSEFFICKTQKSVNTKKVRSPLEKEYLFRLGGELDSKNRVGEHFWNKIMWKP